MGDNQCKLILYTPKLKLRNVWLFYSMLIRLRFVEKSFTALSFLLSVVFWFTDDLNKSAIGCLQKKNTSASNQRKVNIKVAHKYTFNRLKFTVGNAAARGRLKFACAVQVNRLR